jgi:hypothetical protein
VPQRLADLLSAIRHEPDPVVRGRAAALLLHDLAAATVRAQETLDDVVHELAGRGLTPPRIAELLGLPE